MQQLPQERLTIGFAASRSIERALDDTIAYVKERKAFGQRLIDFQNTQFKLAECKTEATVARVFIDRLIGLHLEGKLDAATASMAKYWVSELENKIVDTCLQLFGGYGYMNEYPIARMFRDSRVQRIYGGANEIMKVLIARTLVSGRDRNRNEIAPRRPAWTRREDVMSTTYGLHRALLLNRNGIAVRFEDRQRTFAELADRVARLAGALSALGVDTGDRVAVLSLNQDRYIELFLASPGPGP